MCTLKYTIFSLFDAVPIGFGRTATTSRRSHWSWANGDNVAALQWGGFSPMYVCVCCLTWQVVVMCYVGTLLGPYYATA